MKPSVSVVVPVHNTGALLRSCIASIAAQTLRDIEIICVDDASTDDSPGILRALAQDDPRIRILTHATNQGCGAARNAAVRAARADHIACVDDDDSIDPEMLATLYAEAIAGDYDVVACGARVVDDAGQVLETWVRPEATVIVTGGHRDVFDLMDPMVWNKLWKRSVFIDHDLWFPGQTRHEDLGWTYHALMKSRRIRTIAQPFYNYRRRAGSLSNQFDITHLVDHLLIFERMRAAMIANDLVRDNVASFGRIMHGALAYHAQMARDFGPPGEETLRYLRCVLAIKRACLDEGRAGEALLDAAAITAAIEQAPQADRDALLHDRDAARAALAEAQARLAAQDAQIARIGLHLRDLATLPRGAGLLPRAAAALWVGLGRLAGRGDLIRRGLRLRRALRRFTRFA